MKLASYFNPTTHEVQIRVATDAAPASPFVSLGAVTHEPVDDNLSGAQKLSVSHVIFQHVQEQLYLQYGMQDMSIINITNGGTYRPITSFYVDRTDPVVKPGETITVKAIVQPSNATVDGYYISASNPSLISVAAGSTANEFVVTMTGEGETILNVGVKNSPFYENVPISAQTVPRATY